MRTLLFFVLIVLFCSCDKTPADTTNSNPPASSTPSLVYVRRDAANNVLNIYTNDITGTQEKQVLATPLDARTRGVEYLNWGSNDRIYFLSNYQDEERLQIYSVKVDGGDVKRLSNCLTCAYSELRVSVKGNKLVYQKFNSVNAKRILAVSNLGGTDEREVLDLDNPETARLAALFPSGQKIVYRGFADVNGYWIQNIYSVNPDGSGKTNITGNTEAGLVFLNPFVSPDGQKVAYTKKNAFPETKNGVYTIGIDGKGEQQILPFGANLMDLSVNWSSDGKTILVIDRMRRTYALKADGSSLNPISSNVLIDPAFRDF